METSESMMNQSSTTARGPPMRGNSTWMQLPMLLDCCRISRLLEGNPGLRGVWLGNAQEVLQRHTAPSWASIPPILLRPHTEVKPVLVHILYVSILSDSEIPRPAPRPDHVRRECRQQKTVQIVPCCQHVIAQTWMLISFVYVRLELRRRGIEK